MSGYDSALTIFSPNGELLQVDYAAAAVKMGMCTIAIKCADCVLYGVVKSQGNKLQISKTVQKIHQIDNNICTAFSGLNADARVLMNQVRIEAQSYRLNYEDDPSIEYMARYVSKILQKYTQKGGSRPFGLSMYISGMTLDGQPKLFQLTPSGSIASWKANAIGKGSEGVNELLKKNYDDNMTRENGLALMARCLFEVIDNPTANSEIAIIDRNGTKYLSDDDRKLLCTKVEEENKK